MESVKREIHLFCKNFLEAKEESTRQAIASLQESANEETKSSAGDKYETGRAMAQLEIEKLNGQLQELIRQKSLLLTLDPLRKCEVVVQGAVVETSLGNYYIAVSCGQVNVEGKTYFTISSASPIGTALQRKAAGDQFTFNKKEYEINSVF